MNGLRPIIKSLFYHYCKRIGRDVNEAAVKEIFNISSKNQAQLENAYEIIGLRPIEYVKNFNTPAGNSSMD